jgi:hypothetical protein
MEDPRRQLNEIFGGALASSVSLGVFLGTWTLLWAAIAAAKEAPPNAGSQAVGEKAA